MILQFSLKQSNSVRIRVKPGQWRIIQCQCLKCETALTVSHTSLCLSLSVQEILTICCLSVCVCVCVCVCV